MATSSVQRRFRATFGLTSDDCCDLWERLSCSDCVSRKSQPFHLLWALMLMKVYVSETVLAALAGGVDEKTFQKWAWMFIHAISMLEADMVS